MYRKDSFIASLKHEAKVIKHLSAQIPAGKLNYRPSSGQRSTLELLQYLSYSLLASVDYALTASWDRYEAMATASGSVTEITFAKVFDKQIKGIEKALAKETDASLIKKQTTHWTGQKLSLGEGLIEMALKPAVAYRMQLFLYAKASGAVHLGTSDCWQGKTAKKKKG